MKKKLVITPRFHESNHDNLLSVEKKYLPFFEKYDFYVNLAPYQGISIDEYLRLEKPDAICFAGGYRLYTDDIKNFETEFLKKALEFRIPILAICCGMWTVNSYFGGDLKWTHDHQCFDGEKINIKKMIHYVDTVDLIEKDKYKVNTFHAKSINNLGKELRPFLIADDGVIEGAYNLEKKIICVQFHMENNGVSEKLTSNIMSKFLDLL